MIRRNCRSCGPGLQVEDFAGIEDVVRVERLFDVFHDFQKCLVHLYGQVCLLIKADAVLPRYCPAEGDSGAVYIAQ